MMFGFNPVEKPKHKRNNPKRGNLTRITKKVNDEVLRRADGACEICGRTTSYCFERAHLINASQGGSGKEPWNIALLCGPKVNTGTCHHWADSTAEGKQWKEEYRRKLKRWYEGDRFN
jgi:5-methylcytosine-specific restriction endonuclease McrA